MYSRNSIIAALCLLACAAQAQNRIWSSPAYGKADPREWMPDSIYTNCQLWTPMNTDPSAFGAWVTPSGAMGNHGTQTNANSRPSHVQGLTNGNGCLVFDGIDDQVELGSTATNVSGAITAWIKTTNDTARSIWSMTKKDTTGENYFQILIGDGVTGLLANELLTLIVRGDTNSARAAFCTTNRALVLDGKWHHIGVTTGTTDYNFVIDGQQVAVTKPAGSRSNVWTSAISPDTSIVGGAWFNSAVFRPWHGTLDGVQLFNRSISVADIQSIYAATKRAHP